MAAPEAQQDDSSQWTKITRKGKGKKLGRKKEVLRLPLGGPVENFQPNGKPVLSVDDIKADHTKIASKWHATECYKELCKVIKDNVTAHTKITRAVCLGLGPFDPEDGSWVAQRRSHIQLAAFLAIVGILKEESGQLIECSYQEPRFAQPDKDFLESLGGKIVDSPDSYDLIDETTLVYGVHLYRDIWAAALKKRLPGVFVGTGWDVWEENPGAEKSADFDRIREMEASFDKYPFPQDDYSSFSTPQNTRAPKDAMQSYWLSVLSLRFQVVGQHLSLLLLRNWTRGSGSEMAESHRTNQKNSLQIPIQLRRAAFHCGVGSVLTSFITTPAGIVAAV